MRAKLPFPEEAGLREGGIVAPARQLELPRLRQPWNRWMSVFGVQLNLGKAQLTRKYVLVDIVFQLCLPASLPKKVNSMLHLLKKK